MKNKKDNKYQRKIIELKKMITGNLIKDAEIKGKIHELEMKRKNIKKYDSNRGDEFECFNCGS